MGGRTWRHRAPQRDSIRRHPPCESSLARARPTRAGEQHGSSSRPGRRHGCPEQLAHERRRVQRGASSRRASLHEALAASSALPGRARSARWTAHAYARVRARLRAWRAAHRWHDARSPRRARLLQPAPSPREARVRALRGCRSSFAGSSFPFDRRYHSNCLRSRTRRLNASSPRGHPRAGPYAAHAPPPAARLVLTHESGALTAIAWLLQLVSLSPRRPQRACSVHAGQSALATRCRACTCSNRPVRRASICVTSQSAPLHGAGLRGAHWRVPRLARARDHHRHAMSLALKNRTVTGPCRAGANRAAACIARWRLVGVAQVRCARAQAGVANCAVSERSGRRRSLCQHWRRHSARKARACELWRRRLLPPIRSFMQRHNSALSGAALARPRTTAAAHSDRARALQP